MATIKLGGFVVAAALNPATHTLYVADLKGSVDVIDVAACNAVTTNGCTRPVRKISDSQGPAALDIDPVTNTVYAVNNGDSDNGDTVSVIDGATCNGTHGSGCGQAPRHHHGRQRRLLGRRGPGPPHRLRRQQQRRDGLGHQRRPLQRPCHLGLRQAWPTVTTGANPEFVAVDPSSGTVFVVNHVDDTLSAINTGTCNGTMTSGCAARARNVQATPTPEPRI